MEAYPQQRNGSIYNNLGLNTRKLDFVADAKNKGPDETVNQHSLISAFIMRYLEIIAFKRATSRMSVF